MANAIFLEGVSGVGKSTMAQALHQRLRANGFAVRSFLEGDCANPIDFYAAAYLTAERYAALCKEYMKEAPQIRQHAIPAGDAVLVRYRNGNRLLFSGALDSELRAHEFSYRPTHPVPYAEYARVVQTLWTAFDQAADGSVDYYLFDGSLLHHPLNDLIRNYGAAREQAAHVQMLLGCLVHLRTAVLYLSTENVAGQLRLARAIAGRHPRTRRRLPFGRGARNWTAMCWNTPSRTAWCWIRGRSGMRRRWTGWLRPCWALFEAVPAGICLI